jgi:hypothetical protein
MHSRLASHAQKPEIVPEAFPASALARRQRLGIFSYGRRRIRRKILGNHLFKGFIFFLRVVNPCKREGRAGQRSRVFATKQEKGQPCSRNSKILP